MGKDADGNDQEILLVDNSGGAQRTENIRLSENCRPKNVQRCTVTYFYNPASHSENGSDGTKEFDAVVPPGGLKTSIRYSHPGGYDPEGKHSYRDSHLQWTDADGNDQEILLVDNSGG